jgi:hypothetical protein
MPVMADEWKPNLFIPGFSKCGTTALCDYLSQHPDIYIIEGKEPRTLSLGEQLPSWAPWIDDTLSDRICMSYSAYKELFTRNANSKYRGDGSTTYSHSPDINFAQKLKEFSKDAKILIMVRNQKKRLASMYLYNYVYHREPSFSKWVDKYFIPEMESFLFRARIESFHQTFGGSILVIENSTLGKSPHSTMNLIFDFLELENIQVTPLSANIGQFRSLDESERRAFSKSYNLAFLIGAPARTILNSTGRYGQGLKSKLARFSPTLHTERKFAEMSNTKDAKEDYASLIQDIPEQISAQLECDYIDTLSFCKGKNILCA